MEISRKLALSVGVFVAGAAIVGVVLVVLLGENAMVFADKVTYRVQYPDVGGLREGAQVRLGGRIVGDVAAVGFGPTSQGTPALVVTLRVRKELAEWIRQDSVAHIGTQGLLGDKLIDLTMGTPKAAAVEDQGWIVGQTPPDPNQLITAASNAAEHANNILARLDQISRDLSLGGTIDELDAAVRGMHRVVATIEEGPGTFHDLVYTRSLTSDARATLSGFRQAGDTLRRAATRMDALVSSVDADKVRRATDDIVTVAGDIRAGRGTLGGLLEDPTLYEETKRILMNIERNRVIKALARFVIADEGDDKVMDARPQDVAVHPRPAPRAAQSQSGLRQ